MRTIYVKYMYTCISATSLLSFVEKLTCTEFEAHFTKYDVKRLELYAQNMVDYHLIVDLLPAISKLYFLGLIDTHLSVVQSVSLH